MWLVRPANMLVPAEVPSAAIVPPARIHYHKVAPVHFVRLDFTQPHLPHLVAFIVPEEVIRARLGCLSANRVPLVKPVFMAPHRIKIVQTFPP